MGLLRSDAIHGPWVLAAVTDPQGRGRVEGTERKRTPQTLQVHATSGLYPWSLMCLESWPCYSRTALLEYHGLTWALFPKSSPVRCWGLEGQQKALSI